MDYPLPLHRDHIWNLTQIRRAFLSYTAFEHLKRPFNEGPLVGTAFDDGVDDTRHLGGNGCERLAPEIGIVTILGDVAREFVTKAILLLPYRNLAGDPERAAQPELRQSGLAAILTGLPSSSKRAPQEAAMAGQGISRMWVFKTHSGEIGHDQSRSYTP